MAETGGADTGEGGGVRAEVLTVPRTARYYVAGTDGPDVREVWFVLHGYGQLASFFIRAFRPLAGGGRLVVAPEALSRFYLQEPAGRVGATWMTREERTHEIADYVRYLDVLHDRLLLPRAAAPPRVHLLGFSQGATTACRWAALGRVRPERLVLWAGEVPHDLDWPAHRDTLRRMRIDLVVGTRDGYMTAERRAALEGVLQGHDLPYRLHTFEGDHRLEPALLRRLVAEGG